MSAQEVVLALPAMTLNETEFPDFGVPTLHARYSQLSTCLPDAVARRAGMVPYVQGLEEWLRTSPSWPSARHRIVVGHSFGALLALAWLTGRVEPHVGALVLIAASPGPLFRRVHLRVGNHLRVPFAPLFPLWNTRLITRFVKRLFTQGSLLPEAVDFQALVGSSDAAVDRAGWRNVDWRQLRAMRLALTDFDVRASLHRIMARTIVLHGDDDSLFETQEAHELSRGIARAQLRIIPGAGHALPLSHPKVAVTAVRDLVAELRAEAANASGRAPETRSST